MNGLCGQFFLTINCCILHEVVFVDYIQPSPMKTVFSIACYCFNQYHSVALHLHSELLSSLFKFVLIQ